MFRFAAAIAWILLALSAYGAPKRVLYVTHSAGYRHDSIAASQQALAEVAAESMGALAVDATEDLSLLTAERLRDYDAVFFFTSGELNLSDALLDFVRSGKGFGGAHSATDTLYSWAEYGEMIGGYFDGHPWVQEASVDVEDPENPIVSHLGNSFRLTEEFYVFREFSRDRVRVLLTLDNASVEPAASGDFALAWVRSYGAGRVFYTAFGHFDETWRDRRFRTMLLEALLWLTGQKEGNALPRRAAPTLRSVSEAAPGAIVTIDGEGLTSGSSARADGLPLPVKLAGTSVQIDGRSIPLFRVSPLSIEALIPLEAKDEARISVGDASLALPIHAAAPRIAGISGVRDRGLLSIYGTGFGLETPEIRVDGIAAEVRIPASWRALPDCTK